MSVLWSLLQIQLLKHALNVDIQLAIIQIIVLIAITNLGLMQRTNNLSHANLVEQKLHRMRNFVPHAEFQLMKIILSIIVFKDQVLVR